MFGRIPLPPLATALVLGLTLALPFGASAQTATTPAASGPSDAQKAQPTKAQQNRSTAAQRKAQQAAKAAPEPVIDTAGADQLAAAEQVFTGSSQCEFNQTISVEPSDKHSGYVDVRQGKRSWLMKPVLSATGAVRLEDVRNEALMIQIGTKSMLLNQKTGQRLVDDCRHPRQIEMAAPASTGMLR